MLGIIITAIYISGISWLLFDRLPQLKTMPLNEIGDFLAGIFGALAFFWLVIGYFMQNQELKNTNDSISLQIKELQSTTAISNRSLLLQEEQWKRKKALDHNNSQPKFYCENSNFKINQVSHERYKLRVTIHNEGADATQLMIGFYPFNEIENNKNKIQPAIFPKVAKGTSIDYETIFESDSSPETDLICLYIPVKYCDEHGFYQETIFSVSLCIEENHKWKASSDFGITTIQPE